VGLTPPGLGENTPLTKSPQNHFHPNPLQTPLIKTLFGSMGGRLREWRSASRYASPAARNVRRDERFCSTPTGRTRRVFLRSIGAKPIQNRPTERLVRGFWWIKIGPGLDTAKPVEPRLPNKALCEGFFIQMSIIHVYYFSPI
jgi:hypothetical protein